MACYDHPSYYAFICGLLHVHSLFHKPSEYVFMTHCRVLFQFPNTAMVYTVAHFLLFCFWCLWCENGEEKKRRRVISLTVADMGKSISYKLLRNQRERSSLSVFGLLERIIIIIIETTAIICMEIAGDLL